MHGVAEAKVKRRLNTRIFFHKVSSIIFLCATLFGLGVLGVLLYQVLSDGLSWLNVHFLTGKLSTQPEKAGIMGAILGTLWLMLVVIPITMIIGVATALYLECYAKKGRWLTFIQTNIANLAGVPSIVYGILGLTVFARALQLGNVVLAGALIISLLILPIIIVSSQEALRAVPSHLSDASYGIGASQWQTIRQIVLPVALPSILTGAILALSRAIGETAPLVVLGIPALLIPFPGGVMDRFTVLPMQIYYWTIDSSLTAEYANLAAATIIVLLVCLLLLNSTAIWIRHKFQKQISA